MGSYAFGHTRRPLASLVLVVARIVNHADKKRCLRWLVPDYERERAIHVKYGTSGWRKNGCCNHHSRGGGSGARSALVNLYFGRMEKLR